MFKGLITKDSTVGVLYILGYHLKTTCSSSFIPGDNWQSKSPSKQLESIKTERDHSSAMLFVGKKSKKVSASFLMG